METVLMISYMDFTEDLGTMVYDHSNSRVCRRKKNAEPRSKAWNKNG